MESQEDTSEISELYDTFHKISNSKYNEGNKQNKISKEKKKNNFDPDKKSHFINVPIEDHGFLTNYCLLCEDIKLASLEHFYPELLQKPGKLHMTICVLDLGQDKEKIDKVHNIMTNLTKEILQIANGQIYFNFESFECMGKESSARVIYAKMKEDENYERLMDIVHMIIKALVDEGVLEKSKLSEYHINYDKQKERYWIKLHLTLLNVTFLNKIMKKKKEKTLRSINAQKILNFMNNNSLPTASIEKIHFSRMREDKQTERYEMVYSYSLNEL